MAPFGDGYRQQGEEVPESADVTLVFPPQMSLFWQTMCQTVFMMREWKFLVDKMEMEETSRR